MIGFFFLQFFGGMKKKIWLWGSHPLKNSKKKLVVKFSPSQKIWRKKDLVGRLPLVTMGLNPHWIEPNRIEPNGIAPTELNPWNWTQGIEHMRLNPHRIKPTRDWTHMGLNPQNCTHTGLNQHRIEPTRNSCHIKAITDCQIYIVFFFIFSTPIWKCRVLEEKYCKKYVYLYWSAGT